MMSRPFLSVARRPSRAGLALATLLAVAAACSSDAPAPIDSSLARDLALANVVAQPQFNDAPIGEAPEPAREAPRAAPTPRTPRPAGGATERTTPRPAASPATSRPAPRREAPAPVAPRAPDETPAPRPSPTPAPAPAERAGFAAGTRLALVTDAKVCTVTGRPGDKLVTTLRDPVRGAGGAVIPAGATVVLEVAAVDQGDPVESGRITFRVRSIDIGEQAHVARGSGTVAGNLDRAQVPRVDASDRKKVIGGAIIGAIAGRVLEGGTRGAVIGAAAGGAAGAISARGDMRYEGCLPAGSAVNIVLEEGITLS